MGFEDEDNQARPSTHYPKRTWCENHKVVVYAAERRVPMHRTGTNYDIR
jgi:hypothetical protein